MNVETHGQSAEHGEYYTTEEIDKYKAHYNVIFGKRSNCKTYSVLKKIVENCFSWNNIIEKHIEIYRKLLKK